jgi:6,7-dimethyl-8-ribityllumazine synthase
MARILIVEARFYEHLNDLLLAACAARSKGRAIRTRR